MSSKTTSLQKATMNRCTIEDAIYTNRALQKQIQNELIEVDIALNRLAALKRCIRNLCFNKGVQKNRSLSLFYFLCQKKNSEMGLKDAIRGRCQGIPARDLENINSCFWSDTSRGLSASRYRCYNVWLNSVKKPRKVGFTDKENARLISLSGQDVDWVTLGQEMARKPFVLIRRYKALKKLRACWTPAEDSLLRSAIGMFGNKKWRNVAEFVRTKTERQCLHRSRTKQFNLRVKHKWTREEDEVLIRLVACIGKSWSKIGEHFQQRTGAQCRERYVNFLDPSIKRDTWQGEEDAKLLDAVKLLGTNKWSQVSKRIAGRSARQARRRYYQIFKEKDT